MQILLYAGPSDPIRALAIDTEGALVPLDHEIDRRGVLGISPNLVPLNLMRHAVSRLDATLTQKGCMMDHAPIQRAMSARS